MNLRFAGSTSIGGAGRWASVPGWVACGVGIVSLAFIGELSAIVAALPLAVSALLLGLPHGAVDHFVPARVVRDVSWSVSVGWVVLGYAVFGGLYLVAWFVWPVASFLFFLLMTLFHWGQGDVYAIRRLQHGEHLQSWGQIWLAGFVRGALPMLVPFVAFPNEVRAVAEWLVGNFAVSTGSLDVVFGQPVRLGIAGMLFVAVGMHIVGAIRRGQPDGGWRIDVGETLLLTAFFGTVPPVFAIGLYFCAWHSLRHIVRLTLIDEVCRQAWEDGELGRVVWKFTKDSAPLTILALVLWAGLVMWVPNPPASVGGWIGVYLVFISVLTLPHTVLVVWMDVAGQKRQSEESGLEADSGGEAAMSHVEGGHRSR